jgi:hypothetical protein
VEVEVELITLVPLLVLAVLEVAVQVLVKKLQHRVLTAQ